MVAAVPSRSLNLGLCAALGLDPTKVRSITIRAAAHQIVVVEVEQLLPEGEAAALVAMLKRYTLTPIDKED